MYAPSFAQQQPKVNTVKSDLKSQQIVVSGYEWTMDPSTKIATATITITNNSKLKVKSITVFFTGQAKNDIMLQSNNVHTIRRKAIPEEILPEETKTITVERAFNNPQLQTLKLMQVDIEYENGSLEILR